MAHLKSLYILSDIHMLYLGEYWPNALKNKQTIVLLKNIFIDFRERMGERKIYT